MKATKFSRISSSVRYLSGCVLMLLALAAFTLQASTAPATLTVVMDDNYPPYVLRDISEDPDDKAIVTAIINMAASLGMQTIAEGVETSAQLTLLCLQGCDEAQGYYFSRPLPAATFEAFMRDRALDTRV